ncbi:T9SS type A sorting domain-containing protein [Polaribacter sp. SA4-12]|uniref:T9SS type A sorting domain-containing protein n=1 Tax=Polaribacter sp. SA4-12 TaxID=1312072 RepID=UPI000B56E748|nr:T9SS type A sorting domain-containing protein [Polaribacter sp. SA4-12]ARV13954.1 hypothetical protein BTO07_01800 [Polaribacter sp. SA4-12]
MKKYSVQKSTLTSVGSATVYTNNNKYRIQQSVGQSSIIGKKELKSVTVQQGFLTNTISLKVDNSKKNSITETLDFIISPNPFVDHIKIDFSKKTTDEIYLRIYDINGKVYANKKFSPTDKIVISMKNFSLGSYLIQIESGKNIATKKIIKVE